MKNADIDRRVKRLIQRWYDERPTCFIWDYLGMTERQWVELNRDCVYPEGYTPPGHPEEAPIERGILALGWIAFGVVLTLAGVVLYLMWTGGHR